MTKAKLVPLSSLYREYAPEQMAERAAAFRAEMQRRRSVREFSTRPVGREVIEECLLAAGSAPSGANMQPWSFVVVGDAQIKHRIREAAEEAEREFYQSKASDEWLSALSPIGTDAHKPFLEDAPYLIVIFAQTQGVLPGSIRRHYYVRNSVGIATGILITAVHNAGLVCLPYTPSRTEFLNAILSRPENEQPFLVLVVGYPADGATVPDLPKKPLDEIATFV